MSRILMQNDGGLNSEQLSNLEQTSSNANVNHIGNQCAICLDEIQENNRIITLDCNHFFHTNCILRWYSENSTCPICRHRNVNEEDQHNTHINIQMSLNHLYLITTQINIVFTYPNNNRQHTIWSIHNTLVELLTFVLRSCTPAVHDIMLQNDEFTFKTTESFSFLNKPLLLFNIRNDTEFKIYFI